MMYMHSGKKLQLLLLLTFRLPTCYYWFVTCWWCHVCAQCAHSTCCYRHSAQDDDVYSLNFDSNVQSGVAFIEPVLDIIVNSKCTLPTCWYHSQCCSLFSCLIMCTRLHWTLLLLLEPSLCLPVTTKSSYYFLYIFHCSFTWLPSYLLLFMHIIS